MSPQKLQRHWTLGDLRTRQPRMYGRSRARRARVARPENVDADGNVEPCALYLVFGGGGN